MRWSLAIAVVITFVITSANSISFLNLEKCYGPTSKNDTRKSQHVEADYVPVQPIPGTSIYTGIYYKFGIHRFPSGYVNWIEESENQGEWNFVLKDEELFFLENFGSFAHWYNDIQWYFAPSESEKGWYNLRNRQHHNAIATISKSESIGISPDLDSRHVIEMKRDVDPSNPDALWKPIQPPHEKGIPTDTYSTQLVQLRIKSLPETPVSWVFKPSGVKVFKPLYFQVDSTKDSQEKYSEDGESYANTLFKFERMARDMVGEITQLEIKLFPKLDRVKHLTVTDCVKDVSSTVVNNSDSVQQVKQITQDFVQHGKFTLKFEGLFSTFPFMKITSSSTAQISPPWYADSVRICARDDHKNYNSNDRIQIRTMEHSKINVDIVVPPWSTSEVRVCRQFIDLSDTATHIPADVFLEISERSFRPCIKQNYRAVYTKLPVAQFTQRSIDFFLTVAKVDREDEYDAVTNEETVREMIFDDAGFKILGTRENEIVTIVRASISRGKFGYRGVVASNN